MSGRLLNRASGLLAKYSFGFALVLSIVLLIVNLLRTPHFGITEELASFAPLALAAMASTPAIISGGGGFDLSISPLMVLSSIVFVFWLAPNGLGGAVAVVIVLALGAAVGATNGLLIIVARVPPIVVTLSTYFILIGVDLEIATSPQRLDDNWTRHLAGSIGPIPGALFTLAVPIVAWSVLGRVPFRRTLLAVGSNDAASFASGVNVAAVRIAAYALGGVFAAVGGLALAGLTRSAEGSTAASYTLVAIAAVALGGTSLRGGRGGIVPSLLGAACIYLLQDLVSTFQISSSWLDVIYGVVLIAAVTLAAQTGRKPVAA